MNTEILELLQQNSRAQDWEKIENVLKPLIEKKINGEPVYEFFETLKDKTLSLNSQSISISIQPVESFIPYHVHNYIEMMIPLLGKCVIRTANEKMSLKQDEIIIMGKGTIHKVEKVDNGTIVANIVLKNAAFSINDLDFLSRGAKTRSVSSLMFSLLSNDDSKGAFNLFHTNHDRHIVNTMYDIISEYYQSDNESSQIIRLEVLELFLRLIRIASENPILQIQKINQTIGNIDLLTLLLYIEKNYRTVTLDEMAKYFGFNANYLSGYLKKKTGYTFIKLVHIQRINIAAEYLAFTTASIENISTEVGYENPSYFYKVFKKYIGISPAKYRFQQQD